MDVDAAAGELGISANALRKRLRRGTIPGVKVADVWRVDVAAVRAAMGHGTGHVPQAGGTGTSGRHKSEAPVGGELVTELRARVASLEAALERSQQGEAELRRMLNLEQQTVAAQAQPAMLQAPATMPAEAPERPFLQPVGAVSSTNTPLIDVKALKAAGVRGRKVRRRLLEQIRALVGL
jgi:hypothetical protein